MTKSLQFLIEEKKKGLVRDFLRPLVSGDLLRCQDEWGRLAPTKRQLPLVEDLSYQETTIDADLNPC